MRQMADRQIAFWSYYRRVWSRTWSDIKQQVVATVIAIIAAITVAVLSTKYGLLRPEQTWAAALINALPFVGILLVYLLWHAIRASWKIYQEKEAELLQALDEIKLHRVENASQAESQSRKEREIYAQLGEALNKGNHLLESLEGQFNTTETREALKVEIQQWGSSVEALLKQLDPSFVARFRNGSGIPARNAGIAVEAFLGSWGSLRDATHTRLYRLQGFLARRHELQDRLKQVVPPIPRPDPSTPPPSQE
jgi:hypothetical protein